MIQHLSLGDILPNLILEIYALLKKGNYQKYFDVDVTISK